MADSAAASIAEIAGGILTTTNHQLPNTRGSPSILYRVRQAENAATESQWENLQRVCYRHFGQCAQLHRRALYYSNPNTGEYSEGVTFDIIVRKETFFDWILRFLLLLSIAGSLLFLLAILVEANFFGWQALLAGRLVFDLSVAALWHPELIGKVMSAALRVMWSVLSK